MRKFSLKQQRVNREYSKLRRQFLQDNPCCARCGKRSEQVHHKAGRGIRTLWVEYWLAVCAPCHQWIELNDNKAIEMGYSIPRYQWPQKEIA